MQSSVSVIVFAVEVGARGQEEPDHAAGLGLVEDRGTVTVGLYFGDVDYRLVTGLTVLRHP